jgi:hypothetical protein
VWALQGWRHGRSLAPFDLAKAVDTV